MRLPIRLCPPPVLRAGAGPEVVAVAVPGLGLSVHGWGAALASSVGTSGTALAVALPAFGATTGLRTPLDPLSSAERLLVRMDELGARRVILLGHSASCQVVAEVASRAPDRVVALVLVGPTTDPDAADWSSLSLRWLRTVRWEPRWQIPMLLRDYTYSGLVSFVRALNRSRRHRLDEVLGTVRCPVLLVRGQHDHICPSSWLDRLAAAVDAGAGTAVTSTAPAGAHMLPLTHPSVLADVLRRFLPLAAASDEVRGGIRCWSSTPSE